MKGTLEFNLPEENEEFDVAVNAMSYRIALADVGDYLREKLKYSDLTEEQYKIYEEINERFYSIVESNRVDI